MGNGGSVRKMTVIVDGDKLNSEDIQKLVPQLRNEISSSEDCINKLNTELHNTKLELQTIQKELHQMKCVMDGRFREGQSTTSLKEVNNNHLSVATQNHETTEHDVTITGPRSKRIAVSAESGEDNNKEGVIIELPRHAKDTKAKELITKAINNNNFLKHLEKSQVRDIVDCMDMDQYEAGSHVIKEHESGNAVFVLGEGEMEVSKGNEILGKPMQPGTLFGELAILYNCTRTASVKAIKKSIVWKLDRLTFQLIMKRTGMMRREEDLVFLKSVPLLKNLAETMLYKIVDVLEQDYYYKGEHIVREGEEGDTFFIIKKGQVKVFQQVIGETDPKEIRTLKEGDYFGEKALLSNGDIRTASIVALDPGVHCLVIDRSTFMNVIGSLNVLKEKDYGDEQRGAVTIRPTLQNRISSKVSPILENQPSHIKSTISVEFQGCTLNDFEEVTTLGMGGFGRVELVKDKRNPDKTYALKCLAKAYIVETRQQEHTFNEKEILMALNNPFIIRLYQTFKDKKYVYLLMEVCLGGELWTILRDRDFFSAPTAKFYTACVLEALGYLHSKGIVYRDLKPENILIDTRGYAKLVDFGFAKRIGNGKKTWTFCGTPEYVAPEIILNKGHDVSVDYWSLGILIFELMTGNPPFSTSDAMSTYTVILRGIDALEFPTRIAKTAQHLIKKLCRTLPAERLGNHKDGVNGIRKHKWFQGFHWKALSSRTLQPPIEPKIKDPMDCSNFDKFPKDDHIPPDETTDWDINF